MPSYGNLLSQVLKSARPSEAAIEAVRKAADEIASEIQVVADAVAKDATVEVQGSVAKGTFLANDHDLDIFVLFRPETPRERLERWIIEVGRRWAEERHAPHRVAYAEHPYVTVSLEEKEGVFEVDVVASYDIGSTADLRSAVDRTRFHTAYVRSKITPHTRDQVLLTKQFMRGTGVYGSEVRVAGFSGLLCEVMTLKYGSFLELIKSAKTWTPGTVIDVEGLNPKAQETYDSPLVVIDPTDGQRNAAAAVSIEKFSRFVHASRSFLREPTLRYFFPRSRRPYSRSRLKRILRERGTRILLLRLPKPEVIDDIIYPQIERMLNSLRGKLAEHGFTLAGPGSGNICEEGGDLYVLFELERAWLPKIEKRQGPTIDRLEHAARFLAKHGGSNPYLEGDRWMVDVPRRFSCADGLLRQTLDQNPQDILPSHVARAVGQGYALQADDQAIDSSGTAARLTMTEHFAPLFPWEVE